MYQITPDETLSKPPIPCQSKPSLAQANTTQLNQPHAVLSYEASVCSASQEVSCAF